MVHFGKKKKSASTTVKNIKAVKRGIFQLLKRSFFPLQMEEIVSNTLCSVLLLPHILFFKKSW
jgi:hypothetical protein